MSHVIFLHHSPKIITESNLDCAEEGIAIPSSLVDENVSKIILLFRPFFP